LAATKDLPELQADIEHYKQLVREDLAQLNGKLHEAVGPLSPAHFVKEHALALCGAALVVGFILGDQGVPVARTPGSKLTSIVPPPVVTRNPFFA
jgi:hypothetical protein